MDLPFLCNRVAYLYIQTASKLHHGYFFEVRKIMVCSGSQEPTKAQAQVWATQTEAEILSGDENGAIAVIVGVF